MESIALSDKLFQDEPDSPGINVQSLLHAVSNKQKVRADIDDVTFLKELNKNDSPRSVTSSKSQNKANNIFTHLKNISDRFEKEDTKKGPPPHYKKFSEPPPTTPLSSQKSSPKKISSPLNSNKINYRYDSPMRRSTSPRRRSNSPKRRSNSPKRRSNSPKRRSISPKRESNSPRNTFQKSEEDRAMLLQTFYILQQQGSKSEMKFDMSTPKDIIKAEITRMQTELNSQKMIKFSRKALIAFVSGVEFLNNRYDPFSIYLNGWSEHVMTTLGDYDSVFLRLYEKYKDSTNQMSPEVELMLLLGGSGLMFHLTQSFVQQNVPKFTEVAKENPDLASTIAGIMAEKYAKEKNNSSDDESDDESVTTQTLDYTKSRLKTAEEDHPSNFQIPTEILSTPAFPAIINKMVAPRPKMQTMPKKVTLSTIEEKEVELGAKEKNKKNVDTVIDDTVLVIK